jgi:hypothetical protein
MLASLKFSRIVFIAAIVAGVLYFASYTLWLSGGVTLSISTRAALQLAAERPGLWGLGFLLQAFACLLWALVPVAIGGHFRDRAPGLSQLTLLVGGFGFAWRALADFARAGSMEYLGQLYATNDPTARAIAEQMASWAQLWTFGGVWELVSNGLAFGGFAFLVGLLLAAARRRNLGWTIALLGGIAAISLIGTAIYYIAGIRTALNVISLPGLIALAAAPLWLAWFAWLADRPPTASVGYVRGRAPTPSAQDAA